MTSWTDEKTYPKMTAFHIIILLSVGAPLTPAGGSSWSLKQTNSIELIDKFR